MSDFEHKVKQFELIQSEIKYPSELFEQLNDSVNLINQNLNSLTVQLNKQRDDIVRLFDENLAKVSSRLDVLESSVNSIVESKANEIRQALEVKINSLKKFVYIPIVLCIILGVLVVIK